MLTAAYFFGQDERGQFKRNICKHNKFYKNGNYHKNCALLQKFGESTPQHRTQLICVPPRYIKCIVTWISGYDGESVLQCSLYIYLASQISHTMFTTRVRAISDRDHTTPTRASKTGKNGFTSSRENRQLCSQDDVCFGRM